VSNLREDFRQSIAEGLLSQTLTSCSRWAMHRRIMGEPFPGPYGFKYHPWCREPHDAASSYVTIMKAAQMGLTEVAINRAFFMVDVLKKGALYVLPTMLNASDFSKARFGNALMYSEHLNGLFTDTNTVGLKQAGGVSLYIRGSRGDSNLKGIPVSALILDELDEMDQGQVFLALERLSGHIEKSVFALSTPTVPMFGIHKLYRQGSQEHFYFKCPHCGNRTELVWPDCVEIRGESISDKEVKESFLKCKECGHRLEHEDKPELFKNAKWEATVDADDNRSFYINQLYSYTVTPGELVQAHFRGMGDEAANVEFHNSKLGNPYIPDGGQVTDEEIDNVVSRAYTKDSPRPMVGRERLITMGVDQGKSNHIVVAEYFIEGSPGYDINAVAFKKILYEAERPGTDWGELDLLMREWQVLACVVDADPNVNDARRFARRFPGYCWLCRYRRGLSGREMNISEEDGGAPMATVDRTSWLDATMSRFHSEAPRISLPADTSFQFKNHIGNMVRTFERDENNNARATYLTVGGHDHFAHALCYSEIALPLAGAITTGQNIKKFL